MTDQPPLPVELTITLGSGALWRKVVADDLPDYGQPVLTWDGTSVQVCYRAWSDGAGPDGQHWEIAGFGEDEAHEWENVTHWCHLPAGPHP